jgi:hypothetical protein
VRKEDLLDLLHRQPFSRLRLHLSTGMIFEIRHPEMAIVTRSTVYLEVDPHSPAGRPAVVALLHIAWVEVME